MTPTSPAGRPPPALRLALAAVLAGALCSLAAPASAQTPTPLPSPPPPSAATPPGARPGYPASLTREEAERLRALPGYLQDADIPDGAHILPPPPQGSSPARQADIAVYRETRALQGSERWRLAASDAVLTPFTVLADESCALGARLDEANAPHLVALLTRMARDAAHITDKAKDQFRQVRPFVALGGPICSEAGRARVARTFSYPSGHTTYSWAAGLILAELAPDRAQPILARARAYGESRVVCGVHWVSDVEEGRTNGSILFAALQANPGFQADLAAARRELEAARAGRAPAPTAPAQPVQCAPEAAAHTPWSR